MTDEELKLRFRDHEDGWTERKPTDVGFQDVCKTMSAFANSLPDGHSGILFIGVSNDGVPSGVDNTDKKQKWVRRLAEHTCYPPIAINCRVFEESGQNIVAVIVKASSNRPHFTGPAFVRKGSESIEASKDQFEDLIASRNSIVKMLLGEQQNGRDVIVKKQGTMLLAEIGGIICQVVECNPHYAVFAPTDGRARFSTSMNDISLSWDPATSSLVCKIPCGY
jgi:hypothetical protein